MTFYYIIAESLDDYIDYLEKFEIPRGESYFIYDTFSFSNWRFKPYNDHQLHITHFATKIPKLKIKLQNV